MTDLLARFPRQEDIKVGDFSLLFFIKRLTNVESFKTHVFRYCLAHCGFWKSLVFYENLHHTLISVVRSVAKYLKVSISRRLFIGLRTFSHANKTLGKLTREKVSSLNIYIQFAVSKFTNCGKFRYQIDHISKTYSYMKSATTLWVKHAHLVALQLSNTRISVEFIASNKLIKQSLHSQFLDLHLSRIQISWTEMLTTNGSAPLLRPNFEQLYMQIKSDLKLVTRSVLIGLHKGFFGGSSSCSALL